MSSETVEADLLGALETPALLVAGPTLRQNLDAMAELARRRRVALRPHAKTHKSSRIAGEQLARGAVGLTVSTLDELEAFAAVAAVGAGAADLLLAHPPVGEVRLRRLRRLLALHEGVTLVIDDLRAAANVAALAEAIGRSLRVYWEVDSGSRRLGTAPGRDTVEGVLAASRLDGVDVVGLMTHAGHSYGAVSKEELNVIARREGECLVETADEIRADGLPLTTVSVGSTPTAAVAAAVEGVTEIRPGTYVYNDATQVALGEASLEQCALSVLCTVVGTHRGRAVVDAGSKALPKEHLSENVAGYGIVIGHPRLCLERLYEEHGVLVGEGVEQLTLGERLRILPTHACTAVNLHRRALLVDGDSVVELPTAARR